MSEDIYYTFKCGCKFKQLSEQIKNYDGLPRLQREYYNIRFDCPMTLELLATGYTRGVFQLESNLGRAFSKSLKPEDYQQIAALTAIIRPACLNSFTEEGKTMTNSFIDRKNKKEEVRYIYDDLEKYLNETFGVLVYQEQIMAVAMGLAGFSVVEAYVLQKGSGKKDAKLLFSQREKFIEGCVKSGVPLEIAEAVFKNIEASARYSFCKGHAISYGKTSYITAYMKAHFPLHFFCASLKHVKDKDELRDLMSEVALFNIQVKNPSISNLSETFTIKDGYIQYGYGNVQSVGQKSSKLIEAVVELEKQLNKPASEFTWYEFLILISPFVCKTAIVNLIECGLLDHTGISRSRQIHEYNALIDFKTSKVKMKWISENYAKHDNLTSLVEELYLAKGDEKTHSLLNHLRKPGKSLDDSQSDLYKKETVLMGVALSADPIGKKDRLANLKCEDFIEGKGSKNISLVCIVKSVDERAAKTGANAGKKYANITLLDKTGEIQCSVYTKEWPEYKTLLVEGNVVLVRGKRDYQGNLKIEGVDVL